MELVYHRLFPAMWILWCIYWWIASANSKPSIRRESAWSRLSHIGPLALGALLLFAPPPTRLRRRQRQR